MKILQLILPGAFFCLFAPHGAWSQCAGATLPLTQVFDTTVVGVGNTSRSFSFPQFSPALGTLLSADIYSQVTLTYGYTLENQDPVFTHTYKTKIVRTDDISSPALDPSSISQVSQTPNVSATLLPGQQVNYGPATLNYAVSNSVTDGRLVNFEGIGTLDFDYETSTLASVSGAIKYGFSFTMATDTTHFSITYRYCPNTLLSADFLYFTATQQGDDRVLLNWQTPAAQENRNYIVEVSSDGLTYNQVGMLAENSSGLYDFMYTNTTATKVFFRIQQRNTANQIKYSNTRMVLFNKQSSHSVQVYPSLYTGGDIKFAFPEKGDWQINVYALDGKIVKQSRAGNSLVYALPLASGISNGVYVVETTNISTHDRQIAKIVVQR